MPAAARSVIETRRDQMFPELEQAEIARMRRFGETRAYAAGDMVVKAGQVSPGLVVVLAGEVTVTRHDAFGNEELIIEHGPGSFMGELAQLSGHPALVDAQAKSAVDALVIPSHKVRDLLVGEAELGERIMRALILRRVGLLETGMGGPVIVGHANQGDVLRLAGFLRRNGHPHQTLDPTDDLGARTLLERLASDPAELPIVVCPNGKLLRNPSEHQLARCLGLVAPMDASRVYDVVIVGAGPAGLAAAVYGASEGLATLVLDCRAFGGQAGASARIENYLGFPTGISGIALMARAYNQAQKFGVETAIPDEVVGLSCLPSSEPGARFQLRLANGELVRARAVVMASGARYRRLEIDNLAAFEGTCVHYWATPLEVRLCAGQEVALVGAGNSAGQAVAYLAEQVKKVWLLVRGASLEASMSQYLIERISALSNVEVLTRTEICGLDGEGSALSAIRWRGVDSGEVSERAIRHLFLFIGAAPNTDWVAPCGVALDDKGFVRTGAELGLERLPLETSQAGVFAIGDVRSGSTKRVAAAVGEGAQVVAALHAFFARAAASPAGGAL